MKLVAAEHTPPDARIVRGLWLGILACIAGPLLYWGWSPFVLPWMGFPAGVLGLVLLIVNARATRPRVATISAAGFDIDGEKHPPAPLVLRHPHGQPPQLWMGGRPVVEILDAADIALEAGRIAELFGVSLTDERVSSSFGSGTRDNVHVQRLRARVDASRFQNEEWYLLEPERPRVEPSHAGMRIQVGDGEFAMSAQGLERDDVQVPWSEILEIGVVMENVVRVEIVSETGPLALLVVESRFKHIRQALWVEEQLKEYRMRYGGWTPGTESDVPAELAALRKEDAS